MKTLRALAISLLLVNGIGAIYGGWHLIKDPTGISLGLPPEWMHNSAFKDYLIPGIVLISVNGFFNLAAAIAVGMKWKGYSKMTMAAGFLLCIWLTVQIFTIKMFYPPLHVSFFLLGFVLVYIGYLMMRNLKDKNSSNASKLIY